MFGRTLRCSIAKDNGRTPEFIRKKIYKDKSRCYECGVSLYILLFKNNLYIIYIAEIILYTLAAV